LLSPLPPPPPPSTLFPYTTLFRSFTEIVPTFLRRAERTIRARWPALAADFRRLDMDRNFAAQGIEPGSADVVYAVNTVHIAKDRSEEHTSELQSRENLVCRLLLEK